MNFNIIPPYYKFLQEIYEVREESPNNDSLSGRCFIISEHRSLFQDERRRVYPINDTVFNQNFCSYTNTNLSYKNLFHFDENYILADKAKELFKNIFTIPGIMHLEFTKTHPFTRRYLDNNFCIIITKYPNFKWYSIYNAFRHILSNQIERSYETLSYTRRNQEGNINRFVNFRHKNLFDTHVIYLNTFFDLVKYAHKGVYDIDYMLGRYESHNSSELKYLARKSWKIIKLLFQEIYFHNQIRSINCLRHEMQIIINGCEDDTYDVIRHTTFLNDLKTIISQKWNCVLSYEDY